MASSLPGSERARNFTRKVDADRFLVGSRRTSYEGSGLTQRLLGSDFPRSLSVVT